MAMPTTCEGVLNTVVYADGKVYRKPGDRCSLGATRGRFCKHHAPAGTSAEKGQHTWKDGVWTCWQDGYGFAYRQARQPDACPNCNLDDSGSS